MIFTLADAKTFCAAHVDNGLCSTDSRVLDTINEALQMLMNDDKLRKHTYQLMRMNTKNSVLPMPYNVEAVLKVLDCGEPINVFGMGYEFMESGPGGISSCIGNIITGVDLLDMGDGFPTFFPMPSMPLKIAAFSTDAGDIGKNIRVRGWDSMKMEINPTTPGEVIRVQQWASGVEGSIDMDALTLSDNYFAEIGSVIKDVTTGYVTLIAFNEGNVTTVDNGHYHIATLDSNDTGTTSTDDDHSHTVTTGTVAAANDSDSKSHTHDLNENHIFILSKYHPDETQPGYRRYRVIGSACTTEECFKLMVKMRYVPMKRDEDILPIQNLVALKWMCKAINRYNEGDIEGGAALQAFAENELGKQTSAFELGNEKLIDFEVSGYIGAVENMI